jgi:hypothetical protein
LDLQENLSCCALSPNAEMCAVGVDRAVHVTKYPEVKETVDGVSVIRRTLPVTHCAFTSNSSHVFVSSQEPGIVAYSIELDKAEYTLDTHDVGVKTFALDQENKNLCFVDNMCNAYICELSSSENADGLKHFTSSDVMKRFGGAIPQDIIRNPAAGCKISWHPKYPIVVIPSQDGSAIISRHVLDISDSGDTWDEHQLVCNPDDDMAFTHENYALSVVSFSPCGHYLATADISGGIIMWEFPESCMDEEFPINTVRAVAKVQVELPDSTELSVEGDCLVDLAWDAQSSERDYNLLVLSGTSWAKVPVPAIKKVAMDATSTAETVKETLQSAPSASREEDEPVSAQPDGAEKSAEIAGMVVDDLASLMAASQAEFGGKVASTAMSPAKDANGGSSAADKNAFRRLKKSTASTADSDDEVDFGDDGAVLPAERSAAPETSAAGSEGELGTQKPSNAATYVPTETAAATAVRKEPLIAPQYGTRAIESDDDDDDDDDGFASNINVAAIPQALSTVNSEKMSEVSAEAAKAAIAEYAEKQLHPVVQVASTKFDELRRRYMVWNSVGNITCREEAVSNRIEIRFANVNGRNKQEAFPDNYGFTMAALSYDGAVFATDSTEEIERDREADEALMALGKEARVVRRGSTVHFHAFAGSSHVDIVNENFTTTLMNDEAALSVATGLGWVAVATSKGFLRVFSSTGLQLGVFWLRGPLVALSAYDTHLAVVYTSAPSIGSTYQLSVDLYSLPIQGFGMQHVATAALPLSPASTVTWMGFAVDSRLFTIIDSAGMMSSLMKISGSWQLLPVLNTESLRKTSVHQIWPIMIRNEKLAFVLLNGELKPAVFPQPVVTVKPFRIPFIPVKDSKDSRGENVNERTHQLMYETAYSNHLDGMILDSTLAVSHAANMPMNSSTSTTTANAVECMSNMAALEAELAQRERDADKAVLNMLQEACKQQRPAVAMDLAARLRSEAALSGAIKIANHFGRSNVARRVEEIMSMRVDMNDSIAASGFAANSGYVANEAYAAAAEPEAQPRQSAPTRSAASTSTSASASASASAPLKSCLSKSKRSQQGSPRDLDSDEEQVHSGEKAASHKQSSIRYSDDAAGDENDYQADSYEMDAFADTQTEFIEAMAKASDSQQAGKPASRPANPFAKVTPSPSLKRKGALDGMREMKGSPSPKKPLISVSSLGG